MIERYFLIFWVVWLVMLLMAALRVIGFGAARRWQDRKWKDRTRNQQSTAVIVPVKGFDLQSTPRFFDSLFAQDYRDYRVIVTFESWNDPVAEWLLDQLDLEESDPVWHHPDPDAGLRSITLVSAGASKHEGQKVHNQIAAFRHLNPEDKIVAFADADIVFSDEWLSRLVAPLNLGTHPLSTTYRWLVPKRPTLANQVASVINGSIATQGGSEVLTFLWGGSMALSRQVFDELDVPKLVSGSLNDDLRISKAARKAGNKVAFIRSLILPTPIDFTWSEFFEFAKRQYTQVKFFSPILYTGTNIVLGFYALGALSLMVALAYGYFYAWVPIAAAYVIDQIRGLARQQVYLSLYPETEIRRKLFSACWLEHMLTPVWMLMHWLILISTWTQNRITWGGIQYQIVSKDKTRVISRPASVEPLPVGVPGLALIAELHDRTRGTYTQPIEPLEPSEAEPTIPRAGDTEPVSPLPVASVGSTSAGPFAHPGLSPRVCQLSVAPRFRDLRGVTKSDSSEAVVVASRRIPGLLQTAVPNRDLARLTRYAPTPDISADFLEIPVTETLVSSSVRPLTETLVSSRSPLPAADTFPLRKEAKFVSSPRLLSGSRAQECLTKTRTRKPKRFATRPELSGSSPPVFRPPVASPPSDLPQKESAQAIPTSFRKPTSAPRSHAATRAGLGHRDRRVGHVGKKISRSTRATQASSANRGRLNARPGARGASGRPR